MPSALLGIDLGTSSVKASLLRPDGAVLGSGQSSYRLESPHPGWAEIPTARWWLAVVEAVRQAMTGGKVDVVALCCVGQMHGVVLTGDDGQSLGPAICWPDSRAWAELETYRQLPEHLRRHLGNPLAVGMSGPMLAWLSKEVPRRVERARWAFSPKDWLRFELTGEACTDASDASGTLLWDLGGDRWDDEIVAALGLRAELLPPVKGSADIGGMLTDTAAAELGLHPGLPVAVGCGDTPAAIVGAGTDVLGGLQLSIGSGSQLLTLSDIPVDDPSPRLNCFRQAFEGWYRMAGVQNGGVAAEWALGVLGADWEEANASLSSGAPGAEGLIFVPLLTAERALISPDGSPPNRGSWLGLGLHHRRAHLLRAVLEGNAFLLRRGLDLLEIPEEKICLVGGGSTATAMRQLLADVLGRELSYADAPGASARGAAMLAGRATGVLRSQDMEGLAPLRRGKISPGGASEAYSEIFGTWSSRSLMLAELEDGSHPRADRP